MDNENDMADNKQILKKLNEQQSESDDSSDEEGTEEAPAAAVVSTHTGNFYGKNAGRVLISMCDALPVDPTILRLQRQAAQKASQAKS